MRIEKGECSHCGAQVRMSDGKVVEHASRYHGEVIDEKCPGSNKVPGHNVAE
jgi:hypothetical protein